MELKHQLTPHLKHLRLSGILETLDARNRQAIEGKWSYIEFLSLLLEDEVERRAQKQLKLRLRRASLNTTKALETFDFQFNPTVNRQQILALAACDYIRNHRNVLICGPTGVGKSHLAQALGHEACRRGIATLYRNTYNLFKWLNAGHGDGTHERRMKQVTIVPLLILDDFGLRDLTVDGQADLYEVISERYAKTSTIITSNRDFNEWPAVFSNPLMGSAAMDRLVHRAIKIVIQGNSYRLNTFVKTHKSSQPD